MCSELLLRKWFDEIELLFGPVGHTHNGNDAVHYIHNQIAGNYNSVTPAELFHNYQYAWHTERTRPQPIIVETQYAWSERYKPFVNNVSGFTKTINNPDYIRSFRFSWNDAMTVVMHIKGSPMDITWYGIDSIPNGPGFVCLRGAPPAYPLVKEPSDFTINNTYINRLDSDVVKKYCRDINRGPMHGDLMIMARELRIPSVPVTREQELKFSDSERRSRSGYGPIERIGIEGCLTFDVPFIRARPEVTSEKSFWDLPQDLAPQLPQNDGMSSASPTLLPIVSYSRKQKEISKKPAPKRKKQKESESSGSDEHYSESEEEEEEKQVDWSQHGVPENWPPLSSPLSAGDFVVCEDQYAGKITTYGMSLSQVTCSYVYVFLLLLCSPGEQF